MTRPPAAAASEPSRRRREAMAGLPIVFGLPELEAAASVGVSQTKFRSLVESGMMPEPRVVGGKLVYDVDELRAAFKALPHRHGGSAADPDDYEAEEDTWADLTPRRASGA
jgi:hypothetical protein